MKAKELVRNFILLYPPIMVHMVAYPRDSFMVWMIGVSLKRPTEHLIKQHVYQY